MPNIQKNFQKSVGLYENKAPFLPAKISWKLDLILFMIKGYLPNKEILSIQQLMQLEDLQNLDTDSLKLVFNNIISTLFNKQAIVTKKCQLRKKGIFSTWMSGQILHDNKNFLIMYSKKTYTFEKTACEIKKSKESKRSIDFYFHRSYKYTIKFQNELEMKDIWQDWQKEIIETKTQKNYEAMRTINDFQNTSTYMQRITLFHPISPKKTFSPEKTSFSPQTVGYKTLAKQTGLNKSFMVNQDSRKKNPEQQMLPLKPVPYGYVSKLKNHKSVIAISRDDSAKVYVEHIFNGKYQQKRLLSLLLLQKSWNTNIVMQTIQKSQNSPSQVLIRRKLDSFSELGAFVEIKLRATYTPWNSRMSMIIIESINQADDGDFLSSKSIITLEAEGDYVRISIEDELKSDKYENQKLKGILFDMYRQITKLQWIQEKIFFKDFEAETLITNMLEDDQSTNNESMEELSSIQNIEEKCKIQQSPKEFDEIQSQKQSGRTSGSKKQPNTTILRLKSPLEYPNLQYMRSIRSREFQKNYFKFDFPQQILEQFQDYVPYYRLDKMLQAKIYQITSSRELKFIDQELLDSQKQTLRFVLRQIGANLISGKSILNVSLPVDIFQSRTGLQRSAASFACCPDYLLPMAQSSPIQQMKHVLGFIINVVSCELVMQKPFNPILGETFQGYIRGIPIYYEQISHSPPVSSYYMKCPEFTLYGNLIPFADVGLNTGVGGNLGPLNIVFANGSHFECYFPPSEIAGLIYGDRKFRCYNKGFIFEKKNKLFAQFSIQNQKKGVYQSPVKLKGGQIIGGIFKVKEQFIEQIEKFRKQHKNLKKFSGISKEAIIQKCHSISGEWFTNIFIDSVIINQGKYVYPVEYAKNVLPSDSNHRLDVLYHKIKDLTHSQKEKQILEVIQRNDKKLREKKGCSSH